MRQPTKVKLIAQREVLSGSICQHLGLIEFAKKESNSTSKKIPNHLLCCKNEGKRINKEIRLHTVKVPHGIYQRTLICIPP